MNLNIRYFAQVFLQLFSCCKARLLVMTTTGDHFIRSLISPKSLCFLDAECCSWKKTQYTPIYSIHKRSLVPPAGWPQALHITCFPVLIRLISFHCCCCSCHPSAHFTRDYGYSNGPLQSAGSGLQTHWYAFALNFKASDPHFLKIGSWNKDRTLSGGWEVKKASVCMCWRHKAEI